LHGFFAAQGLQARFAPQGLQGFFAAHGLLARFAPQGLHGFFAAQGLQPLAAHGLVAIFCGLAAAAGLAGTMAIAIPAAITSGITVVASSLDFNGVIVPSLFGP
jgi:hypothetical protein